MAPKKANVAGASAGIVPDFACSTKHNGLEWTGTFDLGRFFHAASGRAWLDLRPSVELRGRGAKPSVQHLAPPCPFGVMLLVEPAGPRLPAMRPDHVVPSCRATEVPFNNLARMRPVEA